MMSIIVIVGTVVGLFIAAVVTFIAYRLAVASQYRLVVRMCFEVALGSTLLANICICVRNWIRWKVDVATPKLDFAVRACFLGFFLFVLLGATLYRLSASS